MAAAAGKVEVSSMWADSGGEAGTNENGANEDGTNTNDRLQGGRFLVEVARKKAPLAVAAPGMH